MADHYQKFIDASMIMLQLNMSIYLLLITAMAYLIYEHVRSGYKAFIFLLPAFFVGYQGFRLLTIHGDLLDALAGGSATNYTDFILNSTLFLVPMTFQSAFILLTIVNVILITIALIFTRKGHA